MNYSIIREDMQNIIDAPLDWTRFASKTVLITGANGFLPSYLLRTFLFLNQSILSRSPVRVLALVRNHQHAMDQFPDVKDDPHLKWMVQDVCSPLDVKEEVHFIFHAASQASPKFYGSDPVGTLKSNIIGTNNLLDLAVQKKVECFFYFSSGDVYGYLDDSRRELRRENKFGYLDPTDLRSCYGESKRMAENMCVSWMHQYQVPVNMARIFHVYGPGMKLNDGRSFADFVSCVVHNQDIVLNSDGSAVRAFCYLSDAVKGFFTIALNGKRGEAYNVGNENYCLSIYDLAQTIINLVPEKHLHIRMENAHVQTGYIKSPFSFGAPDCGKLRALGWEPTVSVQDGFRRTISYYSE